MWVNIGSKINSKLQTVADSIRGFFSVCLPVGPTVTLELKSVNTRVSAPAHVREDIVTQCYLLVNLVYKLKKRKCG